MTQHAHDSFKIIRDLAPDFTPQLVIVCGSGLHVIIDQLEDPIAISYSDLPGFHERAVEGQAPQLFLGTLAGKPVAVLGSRAHVYQGATRTELLTPIRTMKLLGAQLLYATNASGSLRPEVAPGHLVAVTDHINFLFQNPLVGSNDEEFGPRFVSMDTAYDPELRKLLKECARSLHIPLAEGVYLATLGPTFETPAEIRAFRTLGADLVGMSTVPEVIVARHCGMRVVVVSAITNLAAGMNPRPLSHEETLAGAKLGADNLIKLTECFVKTLSL